MVNPMNRYSVYLRHEFIMYADADHRVVRDMYIGTTMAKSEKQAINNVRFRVGDKLNSFRIGDEQDEWQHNVEYFAKEQV